MKNTIDVEKYAHKILDEDTEITQIVHISDIHIKNHTSRLDEYKYVFNNFYKYLSKLDNLDTTIVCITGDILDSSLEKHCNYLARDFIKNICSYTRVLLTYGNHDITFGSNCNDMSNLESVLSHVDVVNPYYLLVEDGHYEFKNVIFSLTSMYNSKVTPPLFNQGKDISVRGRGKVIKTVKNNKIQIALYHGTLKEISSKKHPFLNSGSFSCSNFQGYTWSLLGDIHERQKMKNNILYAGSFLQQNPLEDIEKGGYLINLITNDVSEFNIENNHKFCKIIVDENGALKSNMDIKNIKPNENITISIENNTLDDSKVKKYIDDIKKKNKSISINTKTVHKINNNLNFDLDILGTKYNINDLKKKDIIIKILEKYVKTAGKIENKDVEKRIISKINSLVNIDKNKLSKASDRMKKQFRHIKLHRLIINNVSSFGNNICLDFDKLSEKSITNIYGANDSGKSSLIEAIILAITNKSNKIGKVYEFLHYGETSGSLEIEMSVSHANNMAGDKYIIKRNYKKRSTEDKVDDTLQIKKNEGYMKGSKRELEKYISDNICDDVELLNTSIIEQTRRQSLLSADNKLSSLLNLIEFSYCDDIIKYCNESKKSSSLIKGVNNTELEKICPVDILSKCRNINNNLIDCESLIKKYNEDIKKNSDEIEIHRNDMANLEESIIEIEKDNAKMEFHKEKYTEPFDIEKIKVLSTQYLKMEKDIVDKKKQITTLMKKISAHDKLISKYSDVSDINTDDLHSILGEYKNDIREDNNLTYGTKAATEMLNKKRSDLEKCNDVVYEPSEIANIIQDYVVYYNNQLICDICKIFKSPSPKIKSMYIENDIDADIKDKYDTLIDNLVNNNKNKKDIITREIKYLENRIHNIERKSKMLEIRKKITRCEKYKSIIDEHNKNVILLEKLKIECKNTELELDDINNKVIAENEKRDIGIVQQNNQKKIIDNLVKKNEINAEKYKISNLLDIKNKKLNILYTNIGKITKVCELYTESVNDYEDYAKIKDIMVTVFIDIIIKDQILKKVENSMNVILKNIGIDEITMKLNKQQTDIIIVRKKTKGINILRSGKFYCNIYDLVTRLVINKLNQSTRQDFLICDELLDGVSESNKSVIIKLIDYFKIYYDWVILITHDEQIRQYCDTVLSIEKVDGYSKIVY